MNRYRNFILALCCFFIEITCLSAQSRSMLKEVLIRTDALPIRLQFYTPLIIRVIKTMKGRDAPRRSHLYILAHPSPVSVMKMDKQDKQDKYVYLTDSLAITIDKKNGTVAFEKNNLLLLRENPAVVPLFSPLPQKPGFYRIKQGFTLDSHERIYGLGQHQKGTMDQRNQQQILEQTNMEIAIPVFQSLKGYGIVWNNESTMLFNDTLSQTYFLSEKGRSVDYFFISGNSTDDIVSSVRALTGEAPMPPLWAFGYFQSRERYENQNQLLDVVRQNRTLTKKI